MVTDVLPSGCVLEYHLSNTTYSKIYVYDANGHELHQFVFEYWQMAMAEHVLEMLRVVSTPAKRAMRKRIA